jgi:hypothetical protein
VSLESRRLAGLLLVILPTVMVGGVSILTLLINDPAYMRNPLRQDLWRAGHAHAGVLLVLSLIVLRYVDEADLTARLKEFVRSAGPSAAILIPAGFFLSVLQRCPMRPDRPTHRPGGRRRFDGPAQSRRRSSPARSQLARRVGRDHREQRAPGR